MDNAELVETVRRRGLVSSRQLAALGVSRSATSRAVARGLLCRVLPRVYGTQPLPPWPSRLVRDGLPVREHVVHVVAVLLAVGPRGCARGRTSAALRGWSLLAEPDAVEVEVPHSCSRAAAPRAVVRRSRTRSQELLSVGGHQLRATDAVSTVLDVCRERPLLEAVVVLDAALRDRAVSLEQVERAARRLRGRARRRTLRAVQHADPACGSPLESVLRVRFLQEGMTGWQTQVVVRDAAGRHVLRTDFCFAQARLVVEVDGRRWHEDAARDQRVDNALAAAGWRVLRFSWSQVVHDPDAVIALVRAALSCDGLHPTL
ncbi:MAG: hypothetical protein JWO60_3077 [Frankiales bacterium]|nr:hypothetical protein [Frankiales bacterium]